MAPCTTGRYQSAIAFTGKSEAINWRAYACGCNSRLDIAGLSLLTTLRPDKRRKIWASICQVRIWRKGCIEGIRSTRPLEADGEQMSTLRPVQYSADE
jgi:hypothetical protein